MNFIKKYKPIFLILLPVLILVLVRTTGINHFKTDARKHAEKSFSRSNLITAEKLSQTGGNKLIINLEKDVIKHITSKITVKSISADSILNKQNIKLLLNHDGPVIISSSDDAVSARIWMLLSQMGVENLFILTEDPEPELLKYKFRPDTLARPEL
ncbi:MAG TPA: hypothetical protein VMV47_11890 [Bacteroidales bacterium]|nr:hypothetical protein [Bacteroidales bacterium]